MKRKYLDRIEVYISTATDDGAGGNTITESKLGDSWCNITSIKRDKLVAYGLDIPAQAIRIMTRYRSDLDYFQNSLFFKYKGKDWIPTSITEIDLDGEELDILATAIQ